jgi:hypothetical protein
MSGSEFAAAMLGDVAKQLGELSARHLRVNLVDADVATAQRVRLTRLDPPPSGLASFWLDCADDREDCEAVLARACDRLAGYLVVESVPLQNPDPTPAGERVPGTNMVALLEKPERLSWQAWIHHWHGHHRRVALETQCTHHYVRNVVVRSLTEGAPPWAGIVEEGFPAEAVTDPMLWYSAGGSKEKLKENLARMVESCKAFLDLDRVESHPMSEYRIQD